MNYRQILNVFVIITLLLGIVSVQNIVHAENYPPVTVHLDGTELEFKGQGAVLNGGTVLIPAKSILESMDVIVEWDQATSTLKGFQYGSLRIEISPNKEIGKFDGKPFLMDSPPQVLNGTLMVPSSFVTQLFNYGIEFEPISNIVKINKGQIIVIDPYATYNERLKKMAQNATVHSGNLTSDQIKNRIYNINAKQLNEAINEGKKTHEQFMQFRNKYNLPVSADTLEVYKPKAEILTPYSAIALSSFLKYFKYQPYSVQDANKVLKEFSGVPFQIHTYGDKLSYDKDIHVVLKQGNKIIQPQKIDGKDSIPTMTGNFPSSPAYENLITIYFPFKDIDFTKPSELLYLYVGNELYVSYKVDFRLYK